MIKVQIKWITATCYIIVFAAVIFFYIPAREIMIAQTAWINIIKSNFTLNIFLAFFMWGVLVDKLTKKLSRTMSWIIWGIGLAMLILFFQYVGGFKAIWEQ